MNLIEALMQAGFTKHESTLYITLCREGVLSGYEASKLTGIPRSNAYLGLAGLMEKGGANKIVGDTSKYAAVQPTELIRNLKRQFEEVIGVIERESPELKGNDEAFITVSGRTQIINKMKNLIADATQRVYISASGEQLRMVMEEIIAARDRGLKVVVITSNFEPLEGIICFKTQKQSDSIRLITDSAHVLTGQLSHSNISTCIYTINNNMVELIKDSLTNEMKLISLKNQ